jgi:DNA-binding transcriptional MocR family regulator
MTRYAELAGELATLIEKGVLRAGERMPSTRKLSGNRKLSVATVMQAYYLLEDSGLIAARPRSGYYVNANWKDARAQPQLSKPPQRAAAMDVSELVFEVLGEIRKRNALPLGSAFPSPLLFPLPKLAQLLGQSARRLDPWKTVEDMSPGNPELRRQIAKRYSVHGVRMLPDDIVITSGALEALNLCLQAVTRAGDVVAIESPAFYGALQAIERLGLKAVAVATHPREGVDLGSLDKAIRKHGVKACWLMPTFQNPLGALMPDGKKKELVELLATHRVPLIEDDVYAELYFGAVRPLPAKAYDRAGLVMHCSSFSKSVAPGYRVGWCAPGIFAQKIERLKLSTSIATSIPVQGGLAEYLKHGGYDHHLRGLRRAFQAQQADMLRAIQKYFPLATRATRPAGGYFLWVELPPTVDALALHRRALKKGISITPGPLFAPGKQFANCVRLNYGHPWSEQLEAALLTLGRMATAMA